METLYSGCEISSAFAGTRWLAVIACAVLAEEVKQLLAERPEHLTDLVVLPQRLHEEPRRLRRELQAAIDQVERKPATKVIALVYGLCSRGVEDLRHERCPLVLARAHDCVTLFLGSKERYAREQSDQPGTYWYTPGWIESGAPPGPGRTARLRAEYAEKFDPETVEDLMEMEAAGMAHYARAAYVDLGLQPEATAWGPAYTKSCAACLGWSFERLEGDPQLLRDLLHGGWDEERFLIVPPGYSVRLSPDERVVRAEPATDGKGGA
ncbi:DUF1638 domain-containing protein [Actomonas aquatica]|uniref:DUF1638 domain-containing protein n=1 Tax=Actomonas aquatica TaxID=2866162 RepID=A0ABZ1C6M9_9BACT|nr:DUF1638 domain-containing protein [Opitutus sp. WL0086]WRQ87371.1 DUF1638 domain-containing protein [Opitutus sp. WL0086]